MADAVPATPPVHLRFKRRLRPGAVFRELWGSRELVRAVAERDIRARYKQSVLGAGWAVLTPFALMVVFSLVFDRIAKVDTGNVPYPLFSYLGLLPWTFFSKSLSTGGMSLIQNKALLNKVYCPREVFPLAGMATAAVDTVIATSMLGLLFVITGFTPRVEALWAPVLLLIQVMFTCGVTLLFSGVVVYFRDLSNAMSIILQLGLFATPVGYGMEQVPASLRGLYSVLNPLAPVIDGYRRTVLHGLAPNWELVGLGAASAAAVLVIGYVTFKRLETGFADVA